ncbi:MAG TPA: alpha/beta fold hydrolase [Acetobacteraceae bacterium]|nr:alpha/beta fold hydrolase [Acetobacteraceae bacterium]
MTVVLLHGIGGPAWGPVRRALRQVAGFGRDGEPPPQPSPATAGEGEERHSLAPSPAVAGEGERGALAPSPAVAGEGWGGGLLDWPLPGYGDSAPLPETSFEAIATALWDALDARGIARADLIGHSIGGMVALEFVARFPDRVRSLVLYATTPSFGGRDPAFAEAFLRARLGPLDAGLSMAEAAPRMLDGLIGANADPAALPAAIAALSAVPEAVYRSTVRCLTTFDRRDALPRITVPTLLIAGEHDKAAPLRTMQRMAEAIPGARLVVLPGAGHLGHLEQPATFHAALVGFLASLPQE